MTEPSNQPRSAPTDSPLPGSGATVAGGPAATSQAVALLQRALAEIRRSCQVAIAQALRLGRYGAGWQRGKRLEREEIQARAALGRRLHEAGVGDENLRAQLTQLDERLKSVAAAKGPVKLIESERTGLCIRLAEPYLTTVAPVSAEAARQAMIAAVAERKSQQDALSDARVALFPAHRDDRLRVGLTYGAGAGLLLFAFFWLVSSALGPGSGKLVGVWAGKASFLSFVYTTQIEFKSSGRVAWSKSCEQLGFGESGVGSWKVDRVEGNRYVVHVVNDLAPDETTGWEISFESANRFTIGNFMGLPVTHDRKR